MTVLQTREDATFRNRDFFLVNFDMGPFNNYVDKMRGEGVQKISVFIHVQGIKMSTEGGGVKKWQNSVHVVVE